MQDRETTSIVTPVGKQTIVLKTYLTGREKRALTNVYLTSDLDFNPENSKVKGLNAGIVDAAQNLAWKTIIVSIDGKKDGEIDLVNCILDMRGEDFDFIVAQVNAITAPKISAEKKTI